LLPNSAVQIIQNKNLKYFQQSNKKAHSRIIDARGFSGEAILSFDSLIQNQIKIIFSNHSRNIYINFSSWLNTSNPASKGLQP
jgi:hypothetical protein